jgi:hypothetical protein
LPNVSCDAPSQARFAPLILPLLACLVAAAAGAIRAETAPTNGELALRVTDLRCEYLTDPVAIYERAPRLCWRLA